MINIISKKHQADAFSKLKASAGSWDRYRSSLDVNTPLNHEATLLLRVNLAVEDNQSFRDHVGNERQIVSPSLSWQLDADTLLLIESEFTHTESVFDSGIRAVNNRMGAVKNSRFMGEPNDGSLMTVYQFQKGRLRGSDIGAAFNYEGRPLGPGRQRLRIAGLQHGRPAGPLPGQR